MGQVPAIVDGRFKLFERSTLSSSLFSNCMLPYLLVQSQACRYHHLVIWTLFSLHFR
jgi:hypothetical protein